jgi:hypothetical protein
MPSGMYCFSPIIATLAGSDIVAIVTPALAAVGAGAGALWHRANKVRDAQSAELAGMHKDLKELRDQVGELKVVVAVAAQVNETLTTLLSRVSQCSLQGCQFRGPAAMVLPHARIPGTSGEESDVDKR